MLMMFKIFGVQAIDLLLSFSGDGTIHQIATIEQPPLINKQHQ